MWLLFKGMWRADWGMSHNSSTTLDHIVASALNSTNPPLVLYAADYTYAGGPLLQLVAHMYPAQYTVGRTDWGANTSHMRKLRKAHL